MPIEGLRKRNCKRDGQTEYEDVGNSSWWTSQPHLVSAHERSLYVHQGEIGYGISGDQYDVVGSDDATTCFIVLARHRKSGHLLAAHVDTEARAETLGRHIDSLTDSNIDDRTVDIYISGGIVYIKDSVDTLAVLLESIQGCSSDCHLRLLNFEKNCGEAGLSVNASSKLPRPIVLGCGFIIKGKDVSVVPMKFPLSARGPLAHHRQALMLTTDEPKVVYQSNCNRLLISPAWSELRNLDKDTRDYFRDSLSLPDDAFIEQWSTSPHCEPPHFISEMRSTLLYIVSERNDDSLLSPDIINGASFQLQQNEWVMVC